MLSINKSGDLKIHRRKCRLMKKSDLVKVAQNMGVPTAKKTTAQICASMKASMNNIPLAKMYPQAKVKKPKAKVPKATAANKKAAMNFMKGMVTTNNNMAKLQKLNVKPSKKAQPLTVDQAAKRIMAMKSLSTPKRRMVVMSMKTNKYMSPRRYVKMAREMGRLA
jgi:hypothetical protein